jgi:ABC-type transporter Mla maintaining outer membrane lipid asymmetry permease subunit MlaE
LAVASAKAGAAASAEAPGGLAGRLLGAPGRLLIRFWGRRLDQAAFLGRLFLCGLWGLDGLSARRTLMRRLTLAQVYAIFSGTMLLLVIFGLMMGVLWTTIWFGVLANIGGSGVLASLLIKVHLLEISPILTTLVVIMAYGGPMTMELCLLKSSGDFDTLLLMGIPPEHVLAWPRLLGLILAFPGLLLLMNMATWLGAWWGVDRAIDLPLAEFASDLYLAVDGLSFLRLAAKSLLISVALGFFLLYNAWALPRDDFRRAPGVVRRAMCEAFVYGTLAGVLVTILYG